MLLPIAVWGIFGFSEIYYLCDGWTILIAALTAYLMLSFGNSFLSSIRTLYVLLALPGYAMRIDYERGRNPQLRPIRQQDRQGLISASTPPS